MQILSWVGWKKTAGFFFFFFFFFFVNYLPLVEKLVIFFIPSPEKKLKILFKL